jgi:predicted RNase H-like HicB family nuclease
MAPVPAPAQVMYELTFAIRVKPDEDTGLYESFCVELKTASCGKTIEEALHNIRAACELELDTFDTSTELVKYLRSFGVEVFTDGDAFREMDRMGRTLRELQQGILSTPERFTRQLASV